jgi:hypothetical protein
MKKALPYFAPFVFCAFLSLIALVGVVGIGSLGSDSSWWKPAYFGFLPMCFFIVGAHMLQMRNELEELRKKVTDLAQTAPTKPIQKP